MLGVNVAERVRDAVATALSAYQLEKAKRILSSEPEISHRKLAEQFEGISRATLIRLLREEGLVKKGGD